MEGLVGVPWVTTVTCFREDSYQVGKANKTGEKAASAALRITFHFQFYLGRGH